MLSGSPKYWSPEFKYSYLRQGLRFIWPCQASSAITTSESTGLLCLSQEFALRVSNIRSYVLTADFLAKYPELVGEAPQLEPSPNFYTPNDVNFIESLYWRLLKEKSRAGEKDTGILHCNRSSPFENSETAISVRGPRTQTALALQDLLNPGSPEAIQRETPL